MVKIKKIRNSDGGAVGMVVTILIIGLIISVISIIQLAYMPQWQEQREADHLHDVAYQFSQLKYTIDILSTVEQKNSISTYINLGIPDYPILGSGRTYDKIEVLSDKCILTFTNKTLQQKIFSLGIIKYSSSNSRYVDQSYIFEAGALILSQLNTSVLISKPFLSVSNNTNISLNLVNILESDGKTYAGGYGTYSVYMEFSNSSNYFINDLKSISISTNYKNAWRTIFNSSIFRYSGLTYSIIDNSDGITINFTDNLGNCNIKVVDISTQIAPGWVE